MRDDDALDLSAWDAPPPPDGIADAVIARMGGTAVGPAMPDEPPSRKRALVIAASAAAVLVVAAGAWAIVRGREKAPPASGEVVADRAQHVELGAASVDLDRGADIRWRRTGGHLHVEQKAGTAVWRVGEEHVEIAAAVASIDAAGASLRVEVPMNLSDARVIGASTVTAAAVAMVTVVVYEGHVNVRRGDQTVVVQPGSTYVVPQPQPPPVVGVAPLPSNATKVAVLGLEGWNGDAVPRELVEALRARANTAPFVLAPGSEKELVDERLLHDCMDDEPACMAMIGKELGADVVIYGSMESRRAGYQVAIKWFDVGHASAVHQVSELIPPEQSQGAALRDEALRIFERLEGNGGLPETPDEAVVQQILAGNSDELRACVTDNVLSWTVTVTIDGAGKARSIQTRLGRDPVSTSPCVSQVIQHLAFPPSKQGGTFTRQLKALSCNVDALIEEGNGYLSVRDDPDAALAKYEAAIACKPQARLYKLAFTAACKVPSAAKARTHWTHLSAEDQRTLLPLCLAHGISRDALDGVAKKCDAEDLITKGEGADTRGDYAAALMWMEKALACDPSQADRIAPMVVMEACKGNDGPKALSVLATVKEPLHSKLALVCARQGVTPKSSAAPARADGPGSALITSTPPARILIDGTDTGQTTPATLELAPGKHKLTLQLGGDRFTYPLTIKAGETTTISKDLQ